MNHLLRTLLVAAVIVPAVGGSPAADGICIHTPLGKICLFPNHHDDGPPPPTPPVTPPTAPPTAPPKTAQTPTKTENFSLAEDSLKSLIDLYRSATDLEVKKNLTGAILHLSQAKQAMVEG